MPCWKCCVCGNAAELSIYGEMGEYVGTVKALLQAGATVPPNVERMPPGREVLAVLP